MQFPPHAHHQIPPRRILTEPKTRTTTHPQLYKDKKIVSVDTSKIIFSHWHKSYHELTQIAIGDKPEVLYQGSFVVDDLFTKSDLLVLNDE